MEDIRFSNSVGRQAIYQGRCSANCDQTLTFTPGGRNVLCPVCGTVHVPKPVEVSVQKPKRRTRKGPKETK